MVIVSINHDVCIATIIIIMVSISHSIIVTRSITTY